MKKSRIITSLLVGAVSLMTMATSAFAAEVTVGQTFDASLDFDSSNAGPVWYSKVQENGEWVDFQNFHGEWGDFLCTEADSYAGVYGTPGGLSPSYDATTGIAYDVCFEFVCPASGSITIQPDKLGSWSMTSANGVHASMTLNDKVVWESDFDKSGKDNANGIDVPQQDLTVKTGDIIRFIGHSLDTTADQNGGFLWDPKIAYTAITADTADNSGATDTTAATTDNSGATDTTDVPKTGDNSILEIGAMISILAICSFSIVLTNKKVKNS